jgi:DNA-damage-inducible protein J
LTTTEAFTTFATKVAKEKRISFEVAVDPFYSDQDMEEVNCPVGVFIWYL